MPFYEYQCQACEHAFEKLQKMSDDPLLECPACHEPKLKKLVSASGFQLKGDGWYVTDFRDKKQKSSDTSTSSSAADKTDAGSTSDTKAASSNSTSDSGAKSTSKSDSASKSA